MKRPNDIDETASRANDMKTPEEREAEDRGGPPAGGKDSLRGGKQRRPGRG